MAFAFRAIEAVDSFMFLAESRKTRFSCKDNLRVRVLSMVSIEQ